MLEDFGGIWYHTLTLHCISQPNGKPGHFECFFPQWPRAKWLKQKSPSCNNWWPASHPETETVPVIFSPWMVPGNSRNLDVSWLKIREFSTLSSSMRWKESSWIFEERGGFTRERSFMSIKPESITVWVLKWFQISIGHLFGTNRPNSNHQPKDQISK